VHMLETYRQSYFNNNIYIIQENICYYILHSIFV
jgi:hypothetical protein